MHDCGSTTDNSEGIILHLHYDDALNNKERLVVMVFCLNLKFSLE